MKIINLYALMVQKMNAVGCAALMGNTSLKEHLSSTSSIYTDKKISAKKCSWGLKNKSKIIKKKLSTKFVFPKNFLGKFLGGILGCLVRPTPHPGVVCGRKTIHFFL